MGPCTAIWSYLLDGNLLVFNVCTLIEALVWKYFEMDRMRFWFKSLGFSCFHWGKDFCLSFICSIKYLAHVWTAWNDKWICNYHTLASLELASFFYLKDLPMKNRITNSMCIFRRKNICSNPCVSIFHKSVWVSLSFNTNRKKIDLDWHGFALQ